MQPPESAPGSGDSGLSEPVVRDLRELQECRERLAMFEKAANERLQVIEKGDTLLRGQAEKIAALQRESSELREERDRLERACREAARGMVELANRERTLTAAILELRNEGLIHSIIRRLRSLFS